MEDQRETASWEGMDSRYQEGQEVRGKVTRATQLGVFVQVEPGIEGIIYSFELGQGSAAIAGFTPGLEVQVFVKSIDITRRRLELSLYSGSTPGLLPESELPVEVRRRKQGGEIASRGTLVALPGMPERQNGVDLSCPTCQRQVQALWKYCIYCGGALRYHCLACGQVQPDIPDACYCYACGFARQ